MSAVPSPSPFSPARPARGAAVPPAPRPALPGLAFAAALALAVGLSLFATAPAPAGAQTTQADQLPTLAANGQGEVMVAPDLAIVTIGVTSRAANAADALNANSTDAQR